MILTRLSFWKWIYIKDVIVWVLFVGTPVCFNATNRCLDEHYFRRMIEDNLKFFVLVEFFFNTFTFSLVAEILLQGIIILFSCVSAVCNHDEKYKSVCKMINCCISVLGLIIFYLTVKLAITQYPDYDYEGWIISLTIPLLFSALYVPMAYLMAVYSKCQKILFKIRFKEKPSFLMKLKCGAVITIMCRFSLKNLFHFEQICIQKICCPESKNEFYDLIREYKYRKAEY